MPSNITTETVPKRATMKTYSESTFAAPPLSTPATNTKQDMQFWLVIGSLLVATFLAALDVTAITTALPTIVNDLKSTDFVWITSSYTIASTAFIPWSGGLAYVFGRRPIFLLSLAFFTIGSAVCGAAHDMTTMIIGRTFQGVGSGGLLSLTEIVLADIVSLSERGAFQGAFGATWALASSIGPVIGGALAEANWRWLFFLNLFLDGIVAVIVIKFLNLKAPSGTIREKLAKMDWYGNAIFISSITILTMGLVWGGNAYPWSSAHVLAPLILGSLGLIVWYIVEIYFIAHPTVPFRLLGNRTTMIGFFTTFLHSISVLCLIYYWPAWLQAVKGQGPIRSSISVFAITFIIAPFAMVGGITTNIFQVYKPQNVIGWVFMTLGPGLMLIVRADSSKAIWEAIVVPFSIGLGLLYSTTTFPTLAPLPPSLAGRALAFLVFIRSFGQIIGVTVGSTILNNELAKKLPAEYLAQLPGGVQSAFAFIPTMKYLAEPLRSQVRVGYSDSTRVIWIFLIPIGAIGLIASLFMKSIKLQTVTDEDWGLKERHSNDDASDSGLQA